MGRAAPRRPSPPILSAHRGGRAFRAIRTCGWNNDDHPGKRSVFAVIYTPLLFVPVVVVFTFEMYKLLERERERERERKLNSSFQIYISEPLSNVTRVYTPAFHRPSRGDPLFLHPFLSSCSKIDAFEQDFHRRDRIFFLSPSSNANHRFPPRRNPVL